MRRTALIVLATIVAVIGFWVWWHYRVPAGVEPMGEQSEQVAMIGLWAAIIGLVTNVVILLTRIAEMVKAGR